MKKWIIILVVLIVGNLSSKAHAGFLDTFNKASQALQHTTSSIENAKNTVKRAGDLIPKTQKNSTPVQKVEPRVSTGTLSAKSRTAIEKAKRAWVAAFKAEDWDALVDQYAENAVVLPPDEEAQIGHEAIRANFATDEDTSNEVFETIDINGDENIAYVQGAFSFKIKSGNNPPVLASGKYVEIWEKQSDGNWLITHDIWNANPIASE